LATSDTGMPNRSGDATCVTRNTHSISIDISMKGSKVANFLRAAATPTGAAVATKRPPAVPALRVVPPAPAPALPRSLFWAAVFTRVRHVAQRVSERPCRYNVSHV
jgi:hypothetical protein